MAVNYTALKTEFETDPVTLTYLPLANSANDVANADIINNANGDKARTVDNETVQTSEFVAATTFDSFDGLTASETAYYNMIVGREAISVTADTLANFAGIGGTSKWALADRATMEPRIAALMQRQGSRAEEIADTIGTSRVTPSDVANARNLG